MLFFLKHKTVIDQMLPECYTTIKMKGIEFIIGECHKINYLEIMNILEFSKLPSGMKIIKQFSIFCFSLTAKIF